VRLIVFIFFALLCITSFAQKEEEKKIIQFVGVVFGADSLTIIPNTHIYIPKTGRGTTSNIYGFFSMPVLEGDSVVFSTVGYKRAYYIVPEHDKSSSLRVIIALQEDITFLEEVEIRPYPSEAMFKEALITMQLPYEREYANIYQWINSETMVSGYTSLRSSPNENFQRTLSMQRQQLINRAGPSQIPLLNPFAWRDFIKSLKKKK